MESALREESASAPARLRAENGRRSVPSGNTGLPSCWAARTPPAASYGIAARPPLTSELQRRQF